MIDEFINNIDAIYGTYLDSTIGYSLVKKKFESMSPDLDKSLHIGKGDPNLTESFTLHTIGFRDFFSRNTESGNNYRMIANMTITSIYQLWEDNYREKIAIYKDILKNDLKNDIFGELRIIRNGIIHNNGYSTSEFKKLKIFSFVKDGEINISDRQVEIIINIVKSELKKMK